MTLGPDNAIWDDGEWVSWADINSHLWELEMRERFPHANLTLVPFFKELLDIAQDFHCATGRHLQLYGDIGELFGAITYGIELCEMYNEGYDGQLGDDFVEIKTITPFKRSDFVEVKLGGGFTKLLLVRITEDFEVSGCMVDRAQLPKILGTRLRISWNEIEALV